MKMTPTAADLIVTAIEETRFLLSNWPSSANRPEFVEKLKQLRRELSAAARIVKNSVSEPGELF